MGDLEAEPFVTYERSRGFDYHSDLVALCRLSGFEPNIRHEAATTEAVVGIVACGEGVALVPASARRLRMRGVQFAGLSLPNVPEKLGTVDFAVAWRREGASAATMEFVQRA